MAGVTERYDPYVFFFVFFVLPPRFSVCASERLRQGPYANTIWMYAYMRLHDPSSILAIGGAYRSIPGFLMYAAPSLLFPPKQLSH